MPLDVASDGGLLLGKSLMSGENGIDGFAEVFPADRKAAVGARVIELTAVHEAVGGVEKEKIGRAGGGVGFGDGLGFVVEIRKAEAAASGLRSQFVRGIARMRFDGIRAKRNRSKRGTLVALEQAGQGVLEMDHEGAVRTDEHHEEGTPFEIRAGNLVSGHDIAQGEIGRGRAEGQHG